jgi:hypothetical protein
MDERSAQFVILRRVEPQLDFGQLAFTALWRIDMKLVALTLTTLMVMAAPALAATVSCCP